MIETATFGVSNPGEFWHRDVESNADLQSPWNESSGTSFLEPFRCTVEFKRLGARWHNTGLAPQPAGPKQIAAEISRVLLRNEEARIYHWYATTRQFPPRRRWPDG